MRALNNLKLLTKLAIPIAIVVAVTAGIILYAKSGMQKMAHDTQKLIEKDVARLTSIIRVNSDVNEASIQEKNVIIYSSADADRFKSTEQNYQQCKARALDSMKQVIDLADTPERKAATAKLMILPSVFLAHGSKRRLCHAG
jgi:uncharacterized protein YgbK (DUF1537 family)